MTLYFGAPWGVPALAAAEPVATPVGRPCLSCAEPVAPTDRGWLRPVATGPDAADLLPVHAECELAGIVGHLVGACPCNGFTAGTRATARVAWRRFGMGLADPGEVPQ